MELTNNNPKGIGLTFVNLSDIPITIQFKNNEVNNETQNIENVHIREDIKKDESNSKPKTLPPPSAKISKILFSGW